MLIGIDLLWVRPKCNGGTESYIRNLLDGFQQYTSDNVKYFLFVSKDNQHTFEKYFDNERFVKVLCDVNSYKPYKRIIWENLNLNKIAIVHNIDLMFVPVYSKPLYNNNKVKYITTIHDLQALHFPEYFSKVKYIWLKFAWKRAAVTADKIIAISNFVKNDIIDKLKIDSNKIQVIYNPIVKSSEEIDFKFIRDKYNVMEKKYFYTVSSMLPHKNLKTLMYVMKEIKEKNMDLPNKLLISGIGGNVEDELLKLIRKLNIEENIIITGFVSNEERDCLYKNASVFLFPSIFEGFGMPPIEALMYGIPVVTSDIEVIREVTENKAIYVEKYFDIYEWINKIKIAVDKKYNYIDFDNYKLDVITKKYLNILKSLCNK